MIQAATFHDHERTAKAIDKRLGESVGVWQLAETIFEALPGACMAWCFEAGLHARVTRRRKAEARAAGKRAAAIVGGISPDGGRKDSSGQIGSFLGELPRTASGNRPPAAQNLVKVSDCPYM